MLEQDKAAVLLEDEREDGVLENSRGVDGRSPPRSLFLELANQDVVFVLFLDNNDIWLIDVRGSDIR